MFLRNIYSLLLLGIAAALADPLCKNRSDGNYPLRDSFMHLKCTNGKGSLVDCPANQVYINREERCRAVTAADQTTICEGLPDGDYRDPWHCNRYLKCVAGSTHLFSCRLPGMVYDPRSGKCVYSHQYPCKVIAARNDVGDIACMGKPDGKYPRRDTFTYLQCTSQTGQIVNCPKNQVYIHRERRCRAVTVGDQTSFCEGLPNDDYRDPWNCHMFFKCYSGITYPFNCQLPSLVFNPNNDQCVYSHEYPCTVVKSSAQNKGDNACLGKPDGKYPQMDTFTYLQCTCHKGNVVNCPTGQVYIHREKRCRMVTSADQTTFCEGLPNGDYRHPWNCHMFFKCFKGITYPFNCQLPSLVFNPTNDQCVYPNEYPCTVVKSSNIVGKNLKADTGCSRKEDGKYPLSDTLKYLQCTNQKGTIRSCPTNQVFINRERRCRNVAASEQATFCEGLPNGDYRNPWDCHGFFKCFVGQTFAFNCQKPPLKQLVFHPERDQCVFPQDFPCVVVTSSKQVAAVKANRCTGKPNGLYVIADVFSYLECKAGAEIVHSCPDNQIFVAKKMACSNVTTAAEDIFCDGRVSGNYRNPWNCHHFITCVTGHPSPYDRPCHPLSLVYDPNNDRCEHAGLFPCKNLTSPTPAKNRCTGKPDGLYILPDVFKYLECKAGQEILHFCPSKQIFAPDVMACRAVVPADRVTFCNKRPTANYRNPWNCHHFITCAVGHPVYDRPCHPLTLVYDPDNDQCEHDYLMTCVEV